MDTTILLLHSIQRKKNQRIFSKKKFKNLNINLIDTGANTLTGGRVKRLKKFINNETFLLTYGDGVSDINIEKLINFHKKYKKMVTITAVRPPARFGAMQLKGKNVVKFKEKIQLGESWVNGGFFVIEPEFINLIKNDKTSLEREPLEKATKKNKFKHISIKVFGNVWIIKLIKTCLIRCVTKKIPIWLK